MNFLTVRHFSDQNVLRTYSHDGPLKTGQESLIVVTAEKILAELQNSQKRAVRILYTAKTRRINETARLVSEILRQSGVSVVFEHDVRLEVMDQGDLILPDGYQDGEWFTPLDVAWDAICDESYLNGNLFYRFGDSLSGKYPILKGAFSRFGENLGWSLINKYSLIYDLAHDKFVKDDELLVIVAQSDLPLLIMELQILEGHTDVTLENLSYKCWEVYKSGLQAKMYDKNTEGDGNFDIAMGYVGNFNLSDFVKSGFDVTIKNAGLLLAERRLL
ncbi:MAG: hypothetical protein V4665_03675 [Patescibacteria group bacterium]